MLVHPPGGCWLRGGEAGWPLTLATRPIGTRGTVASLALLPASSASDLQTEMLPSIALILGIRRNFMGKFDI